MPKRLHSSVDDAADSSDVKDTPLSKIARVPLRPLVLAEASGKNGPTSPITKSIRYEHKNCIVVVWCPRQQVRCDIVASLLHSYGKVVVIQDGWAYADACSSSKNFWGGMVVTYENQESAEAAAKGIPLRSRYVKTLLLHKLVECLSNFERTLPEPQEVELNISNPSLLKLYGIDSLLLVNLLRVLGDVTDIKFPGNTMCATPKSHRKVVCQVKYKYATQAFAAKIILEGRKFHGAGTLSTHVTQSKTCDIFIKVFDKMIKLVEEHVAEAFFPDKM